MRRPLAAVMVACTLLAGSAAAAESDEQLEVLETVLVTGEQPGPGLWKVSKGDHVMWVLAAHRPMPSGMSWRSQKVEARIAESQEVLYAGDASVRPDFGMLRALTMIPAAGKAGRNPGDATLRQVLPPETYARWLRLREKYLGEDDDIEEFRPVIAVGQLRRKAMQKQGLLDGPSVDSVVRAAAHRYKVPNHRLKRVERVVRMEDPRDMMKASRGVDAPDLGCFTSSLEDLEPSIERAKARANAWARGDVTRLRELQRTWKLQDDCGYLWLAMGDQLLFVAFAVGESAEAARVKKVTADYMWHEQWARVQAQQEWVVAAQAALEKNRSTFAVLRLDDVLSPDGPLEKLRSLGYSVEEPW